MFDGRVYFKDRNEKVLESFETSLDLIREIQSKSSHKQSDGFRDEIYSYFNKASNIILSMCELEVHHNADFFENNSFEYLSAQYNSHFEELRGSNYKSCYANPKYSVSLFGKDYGRLLASLYVKFKDYISFASQHRIYKMEAYNRIFIDMFNLFDSETADYAKALSIGTRVDLENNYDNALINAKTPFDIDFRFFTDIITDSDLSDLRYLYRYGLNVTENEIRTAKFFNGYPDDKIGQLSKLIVKAYLRGFEIEEKDVSKKSTVNVMYAIGQERLIRQLIKDMKDVKLDVLVNHPLTTSPNKQTGYDHRFDNALYFSKEYSSKHLENFENTSAERQLDMSKYSGIILCEKFGEAAFTPEKVDACIQFTPEQQALYQQHQNKQRMIQDKFIPFSETSFSIIAFPSPEIGDNFERIFEDIMEVNMLDTDKYESIQQKMVDSLDQAEFVHVKGKNGNNTNIKVQMQPLIDPKNQTNFNNCGADMNIPVGEVFTSPQLKGTNGILHVEETYLNGLKYIDLKLVFKDGYICDYSCKNFESEEDNRNYVHENLIFPNETLPIGEFAIGTNTLAYVVARKHRIVDIMPVLIVEKMGPHFAVGDTCYSWQEDKQVYNINNKKEIMSRDNEKSALRKTDINKAYTNTHTDITLPYDTIDFISVVKPDRKYTDIIRDGRFVLKGTEELNVPFNQ